MNIQITPNFQTNNNIFLNKKTSKKTNIFFANKNNLACDTVSFTGFKAQKLINKNEVTIKDIVKQAYLSSGQDLISQAKEFHRALKSACAKVEEFFYDDEYNSKHPIKSLTSYLDKRMRKGNAPDTVRGTVYWLDQTNATTFKKFVDAMKGEGYEIAVIRDPQTEKITETSKTLQKSPNGKVKFVKLPDLEIRQNGITREDLSPLGSFLMKAEISKPRVSTYADWQMRFVKSSKAGKNENKFPMEAIVLYGPHYARAKELESEYVFSILRVLRDELHIDLHKVYPEYTPGRRIVTNIGVIESRLIEDISKPLFTNAYNVEHKIKEPKLPIGIGSLNCDMLNGYMLGIRQKIPVYYSQMEKGLKDDEVIINLIKNSTGYKMRDDKTITREEIQAARLRLKTQLPLYMAEDIGTVAKAHELLKTTIKKFGEKQAKPQ